MSQHNRRGEVPEGVADSLEGLVDALSDVAKAGIDVAREVTKASIRLGADLMTGFKRGGAEDTSEDMEDVAGSSREYSDEI